MDEQIVDHVLLQVEHETVDWEVDCEGLVKVQSKASPVNRCCNIPCPQARIDKSFKPNASLSFGRVVESLLLYAILKSLAGVCPRTKPAVFNFIWCYTGWWALPNFLQLYLRVHLSPCVMANQGGSHFWSSLLPAKKAVLEWAESHLDCKFAMQRYNF